MHNLWGQMQNKHTHLFVQTGNDVVDGTKSHCLFFCYLNFDDDFILHLTKK